MLKPTETLKNFQVFGKISSSEKIAKISKFLEQTANFWKELQKYQNFG